MEMMAPGRGDDLEELIARLVNVTVAALMIWRRCSTTAARRSPRCDAGFPGGGVGLPGSGASAAGVRPMVPGVGVMGCEEVPLHQAPSAPPVTEREKV
uniref:Uncharacterized protein n=1 Tax=Oryza glumipatula TaxID=40148 RepID=A0A0D9YW85_9ORYZ